MSKINKIRLSGTTYEIEDSGATKTVELTQAQYDALVSGGTVDPNTFYVITDATAADLSQYWTSAQTQSAITNAVSGKQDTLVSGTNIKTINNESILGSGNIDIQGGGGSTYSAGTNISIDSSNNINCTIPLSAGTGNRSVKGGNYANASSDDSFAFGSFVNADGVRSVAFGDDNRASKQDSFVCGFHNVANGEIGSFATGIYNNSTSGQTDSGNTLFSVGNGTANNARHNAFEIKTNGDIYITSGSSDIKLQDHLGGGGGGGSTYSAGTNISIDSSNNINCTIPLSAGTGTGSIVGGDNESSSSGAYSFAFGHNADATAAYAIAIGSNVSSKGQFSVHIGDGGSCNTNKSFNYGDSNHNFADSTTIFGSHLSAITNYETALGYYNKSLSGGSWTSGSTIFTIGNGYSFGSTNKKHNAFEVRGNGDVYIPNTDDTTTQNYYEKPMVRLQDTIAATAANTTALGGMKIVKLTESEYTALVTKDSNTLYVVVADPSN